MIRRYRVFLLLMILPIAPMIGRYGRVAWSAVDGVYSDCRLSKQDRQFRIETEKLNQLHTPAAQPHPGEWRYSQIEPAQTFAQFARSNPGRATTRRNVIYVQPLGRFTSTQREIVELCGEFLGIYFRQTVKILPAVDSADVPPSARRIHPETREEQLLASWVHTEFLKPRLPEDAVTGIVLTSTDLWPGGDWNFVFGQASVEDRVGVWSMARFGDPTISPDCYLECLRRTLKIATHETGHMLSLQHCVHFECNMSGTGSLAETDRHPLFLCPECLAKLNWSLSGDASDRLQRLADFCEHNALATEYDYYSTASWLLAR